MILKKQGFGCTLGVMTLKCMDPEEVLKLLEGHKDIITPMAEEREILPQPAMPPMWKHLSRQEHQRKHRFPWR